MYTYSNSSKQKLNTVDKRLQKVFNEVIKYYDCSIICGLRTFEEQQQAFKMGNSKCDGEKIKSKHQQGLAVDVVPYPLDWNNINSFYELAGCIKTIANQMNIKLSWGGEWKTFKDFPHWELSL